MSKETDPQPEAKPRLFSTPPVSIVVFRMEPFDEPKVEIKKDDDGKTDGIRRVTGRHTGEQLHVRSEVAHIDGKTAYPLDGGPPLPYGPGKPGHWAKNALTDKATP